MLKSIYFLVADSANFKDKLDVMKTFFEKEGGFSSAFTTAIVVAAIICVLYYVICRFSFAWSKLSTWVITLFVAGAVSFAVTGYGTGIQDKRTGKIYHTLESQWKKKTTGMTPEQIQTLQPEKKKIQDNLNKGMFSAKPINSLCWTNFFLTMIFFYVFSIVINGLSGNGSNIPHRGLIRL